MSEDRDFDDREPDNHDEDKDDKRRLKAKEENSVDDRLHRRENRQRRKGNHQRR